MCARTYTISFLYTKPVSSHHLIAFLFEYIPRPQHLLIWEIVRAISASKSHPYRTHIADRAFAFCQRYSNTLLVSLNNRISFRDMYGAPCEVTEVVDLRAPPFPTNGASSEAAMETIVIEPEKPQKGQPAEVEECE